MRVTTSDFSRTQGSFSFCGDWSEKKKPEPQQQQKNNTCENVNELPYFTMSVECSK